MAAGTLWLHGRPNSIGRKTLQMFGIGSLLTHLREERNGLEDG